MADDFSGSASTTGVLAVGGFISGDIEAAGDSDWFAITLAAGTRYQFFLQGSQIVQGTHSGGTLPNSLLRLRDSSGAIIATADNEYGFNALLNFTAQAPGMYYLDASTLPGAKSGYRRSRRPYQAQHPRNLPRPATLIARDKENPMRLKILAIAGIASLAAACGTTPGERALSGGAMGAVAGAVIGNNTTGHPATGAVIGGLAGAGIGAATAPRNPAVSSDVDRRQYFDQRSGRYYYYDAQSRRYYYENGQPYP